MPDQSYGPKVYKKDGGDTLVVASGGQIVVEPGGVFAGAKAGTVASGAAIVLTAAQSGSILLFDVATALQYTLPPPAVNLAFTFITTVTQTSGNHKIITDAAGTFLMGGAFVGIAAGTGTQFWGNGTTHIAFTQNGTTTGGLFGSIVYAYCVNGTQWQIDATVEGSGTIATPFATS